MSSILFEKKRVDVNRFGVRLTAILVGLCLSFYWQALPYFQQDIAAAVSLNRWLLPGLFRQVPCWPRGWQYFLSVWAIGGGWC